MDGEFVPVLTLCLALAVSGVAIANDEPVFDPAADPGVLAQPSACAQGVSRYGTALEHALALAVRPAGAPS